MKLTDMQIGASGLAFMKHYIATYKPEFISPSGVLLGVLIFIVAGLVASKIIDKIRERKKQKIVKTNDLVTPRKGISKLKPARECEKIIVETAKNDR